jgi:hypothetical protein
MDDDNVILDYQDSLWLDETCEIALYHTQDKRAVMAPWCAVWAKNGDTPVRAVAVTKDRAVLKLLRELDVQTRNRHLGPLEEEV